MRSLFNAIGKLIILGFIVIVAFVGCIFLIAPEPMTPEQAATAAAQRAEKEAKADAELAKSTAQSEQRQAELKALQEANAARPQMNAANFARIREGMTFDEVVAIVGQPSQLLSSSEIGGIKTAMYQWDAGIVANANAMFQDGKMVSKAQFGL